MLRNLNQSSGGRRILGVPQVGILAATIASQTATGDNGAGLLYDESINPANAGKQLRLVVTSPPSAGVFFAYENGSFDFSGAPDGSYSIGYNVLADKLLTGSDTATVAVGAASATAPGVTLTGASSISAGAASGQQSATAPGAVLTGSGSISAGAASGGASGDASTPGVTLSGSSTISAGTATGNQDATAPGATLTGSSTISAGTATGGAAGDATAPGAVLSGSSTISTTGASAGPAPGDLDNIVRSAIGRIAGIKIGVPSPGTLLLGETIRLIVQVTDILGEEVDPPALSLKIKRPASAVATVALSHIQEGQYFADLTLDKAGHWYWRAESSLPHPAISEGAFVVQPSRFL